MNDTRKLRAAKQMRRDIRRARKRRPSKGDDDVLVTMVRKALAKHPASLLGIASCFVGWATPEPFAWVKGGSKDSISLEQFVSGLAGRRLRETTALLAVLAELLVEDDGLRERCRSEVATRHDLLPKWLTGLSRVEVLRVLRRTELLGDGDELLTCLRLKDATELTLVAFVDHNELSGITEIGVLTDPLDRVLARAHQKVDGELRFEEMELADARTVLEYGLRTGAFLPRSDEWRLARPLLRWVITLLPEGGRPYFGPSMDERAASELLDGFFASPAGAPFRRRPLSQVAGATVRSGMRRPVAMERPTDLGHPPRPVLRRRPSARDRVGCARSAARVHSVRPRRQWDSSGVD
ncbi:hypothetical protein [Mycobacterium antarcticum]|uniref:hypothetical protein n=1 Tax=unclassified Mycolicibacterium TaxID=2636767 RepID=UPI0024E04F92|nr:MULTISPECIES: hypothetical protein [unclassified Mycolicibacterium]